MYGLQKYAIGKVNAWTSLVKGKYAKNIKAMIIWSLFTNGAPSIKEGSG